MRTYPPVPDRFRSRVIKLAHRISNAYPDCAEGLIERTFMFAYEAHDGQMRADGVTPYIEHPLAVAEIVAYVEFDPATVQAALLHDTVEDCPQVTLDIVRDEFGDEVAKMVDSVTKITRSMVQRRKLDIETTDPGRAREICDTQAKADTLRKILIGVTLDVRVLAVKLADRLHNMRSISALSPEKRSRMAAETLQIYAPLAEKLGVWRLRSELEELALHELEPDLARSMRYQMDQTYAIQEPVLSDAMRELGDKLRQEGIHAKVQLQKRHLYEVVMKTNKLELDADKIFDLFSIVVVVPTVGCCYRTLGVVHGLWTPVAGKFEDFIARNRPNFYAALHTTVVGFNGMQMRILIRSDEMNRNADYGLASYWSQRESPENKKKLDRRLTTLQRQLEEWTQEKDVDANEYLRLLRQSLSGVLITVFTPVGDQVEMLVGSTPLDFAFRIHTALGMHYAGAKVNRTPVAIGAKLMKGDVVEIITDPKAAPDISWLSVAHTPFAQRIIRAALRKQALQQSIRRGKQILAATAARLNGDVSELVSPECIQLMAKKLGVSVDAFLSGVGDYMFSSERAILRAMNMHIEGPRMKLTVPTIYRASCCLPLPSDAVYGLKPRRGRMTIHRTDCPVCQKKLDEHPEYLTRLEWEEEPHVGYETPLWISAVDRAGLIASISQQLADCCADMAKVDAYLDQDDVAQMTISPSVTSLDHLRRVISHIRKMSDVLAIRRVNPLEAKRERRK